MEQKRQAGRQIKDLRVVLKELEPAVKGSDSKGRLFLIDGHNAPEPAGVIPVGDGTVFQMRYREAWGNWLLCVALSFAHGQDFTFQEDLSGGDGIIFNRTTKAGFRVEHVSAMTYQKGQEPPKGEQRVVWAVQKKADKAKKNPGYDSGKSLLVFVDGAGQWYPNRAGRAIAGTHGFMGVYCVALTSSKEVEYRYSVSYLGEKHSPTFIVEIKDDFTDWRVYQVQ